MKLLHVFISGIKHESIVCNGCKKSAIMGIRWKCSVCVDYDLCHLCYMNDTHDTQHTFLRFAINSNTG